MFFLQTAQIVQKSTETILNTGVVGAVLVICLIAIWIMAKVFNKQYTELSTRLNKYIDEDRAKMIGVIEKNTLAFTEFMNALKDHEQREQQRK